MAAFQGVRDSFGRLSRREKLAVAASLLAILAFILFLTFRWVGGKVGSLAKQVERQDEQLGEILRARSKYRQSQVGFRQVEAMLKRTAPPLRGFLEGVAKRYGLTVQEYKDLPVIRLGRRKQVEERSIRAYPVKPTLGQLASFMAAIENSPAHLLIVKDLRLVRAFDDRSRFQTAEVTVSTYSLVQGTGKATGASGRRRGK